MADPVLEAEEQAVRLIRAAWGRAAARGLLPAGAAPSDAVEMLRGGEQGDFAASFALAGAGALGMSPQTVARAVLAHLELDGSLFQGAEAAGPGYLNFFCGPQWYGGVLSGLEGAPWGALPPAKPLPRPPASLEEVRRRAWGDALANLLERAGENGRPAPFDAGPAACPGDGPGWAGLGEDALRYFLTARPVRRPLGLDLDLAVRRDGGNPLYRVQYAHARLCTLTARRGEDAPGDIDPALLSAAEERALIKTLARYPGQLRRAAREGDPSRVNRYLTALAGDFRRWYDACHMGGEGGLGAARLKLARCTRRVLADGLGLLGVSAPRTL